MDIRKAILVGVLVLFVGSLVFADTVPPPAKRQRWKGGEAFPPLPLPVTPQRRSEKKRPPKPPDFIVRLKYGSKRTLVDERSGEKVEFYDWQTNPGAVGNLMKKARSVLRVNYGERTASLAQLDVDPKQTPVLYLTGHINFAFTPDEKKTLKEFIRKGGFLWGEACCGAQEFADCFRRLVKELYPDKKMVELQLDHPVFHSHYDISEVEYTKAAGRSDKRPVLEGLDLGCRTAIIFSPYSIGNGWDEYQDKGSKGLTSRDAYRLGINMVAYNLAYHELGRFLATQKVYYESDEHARNDFVFGQIRHDGNWNTDPSAAANLMKLMKSATTLDVKFRKEAVDLATTELFDFPFLYICGHDDFAWSEAEIAKIRNFLNAGGFLLADACCGRRAFHNAFIREMKRVFPEKDLKLLEPDHAIYSAHYKIGSVSYTPFAQKELGNSNAPALYGITIDGATRVVYSPFDLGNGWEGIDHPFTRGYSKDDALRIGVNAILYAQTH
ncbi:MAG: DUF4159 domain-containing protein [Planctomycetota bacterium]|jgi:hypothetical protein